MRETVLDIGGTILHKSVQILTQADDSVIVQKYENVVKDAFKRLEKEVQKWGSVTNYDKAKIYGKW